MTGKNETLVWYAAYGSNLLRERFMAYISGGPYGPKGKEHGGCGDRRPPGDEHRLAISGRLFFSRSSDTWGGGVAFLDNINNFTQKVYCRCYLVTLGQFIDIALQENGRGTGHGPHTIDRDELLASGSTLLVPGGNKLWYNRIVLCGSHADRPVLTITSEWPAEEYGFTRPGKEYLRTIIKGLAESWGLDRDAIIAYLEEKPGIHGRYEKTELAGVAETVL